MSAQVDHRPGDDVPPSDVMSDDPPVDLHKRAEPDPDGFGPAGDRVPPDDAIDGRRAEVVQDAPGPSPARLRVDFGAHLEANYQRLVAQLYAITLDPGEAHDVVQDAYSRAWRDWAAISRAGDPTTWVRRVAVRSTIRSWRRVVARIGGDRRRPVGDAVDPRTGALLAALGRLSAAERRCVVLHHMTGASVTDIAALEKADRGTVQARLSRARHVVTEGMADVLPAVLGLPGESGRSALPGHYGDEGDL